MKHMIVAIEKDKKVTLYIGMDILNLLEQKMLLFMYIDGKDARYALFRSHGISRYSDLFRSLEKLRIECVQWTYAK